MQSAQTQAISRKCRSLARLALMCAALALICISTPADVTKSVSGRLRKVAGNVLTLQKTGLGGSNLMEIEMDEHTKVKGQVAQGWHAKIKYREEAAPGGKGEPRRVALEIETEPEHATKQAKEAAGTTPPPKKDQP
jgi:hypothetical protein